MLQVEEEIECTTYPSFLKSECYLTYLAGPKGADSPHSPASYSPRGALLASGVLPTLPEDCEFDGSLASTQLRLTQGALEATIRQRASAERRIPEAFAG